MRTITVLSLLSLTILVASLTAPVLASTVNETKENATDNETCTSCVARYNYEPTPGVEYPNTNVAIVLEIVALTALAVIGFLILRNW